MALLYLESFTSLATDDMDKGYRGDIGMSYWDIFDYTSPDFNLRPSGKTVYVRGTFTWEVNKYLFSGESLEECVIGYRRKFIEGQSVRSTLFSLQNRRGDQFSLVSQLDGSLVAYRGNAVGTVLSRSQPDLIKNGCFQQIELKAKVHDSTGYFYVRVDGDMVFSGESLDTRLQTLEAGFDRVAFGGVDASGGINNAIADFYVMSLSGEYNSDFVDGFRIDCIHPNAPGTNSDFTPDSGTNWDRVSDGGDVDENTSYVSSATDGHIDTYHFEELEVLSGETTIHGLQVRSCVLDDEISGEILPTFYDGVKYNGSGEATTRDWSSTWNLSAAAGYWFKTPHVWDQDPGGGAWTAATINSGEFGVELNIP